MTHAASTVFALDESWEDGADWGAAKRPAVSAAFNALQPGALGVFDPMGAAAQDAEPLGDAVLELPRGAGGPMLGVDRLDSGHTDVGAAEFGTVDRFQFRHADKLDVYRATTSSERSMGDATEAMPLFGRSSGWTWRYGGAEEQGEALVAAETLYSAEDFTGQGEVVVVIDDGYSPFYDQSQTIYSYDFSGANDPFAGRFTLNSHGSWVADVVTDTAEGVDIIHLKVFDDFGFGASFADIEEALAWTASAATSLDISAVNLSLGTGATDVEMLTSLSDEMALLDDLGVFSIVAAGNAGADADGVNILAADPNAIGVSSVGADGAFSSFSQRDTELTDIAASGENIAVETIWGKTGYVSGTSFAAPLVSGTAARLQEASEAMLGRRLTDEEFLDILQDSGEAVADAPDAPGFRIADADAAVNWFIDNVELFSDPEAVALA